VQTIELASENVSTGPLKSVNHLAGSMTSIRLNKQMDMVGPDRKGANLPVVLFGYVMKHRLQSVCHRSLKYTRTSLRAPHEMILHRAGGAGGLFDMVLYRLASLNR
jgi:hypothetical protein